MNALINTISEQLKTSSAKDIPVFTAEKNEIVNICNELKSNLKFNYLMCISGVDYKEYFEVVYHIYSITAEKGIALKVKLDHANPEVDSVVSVWKSADWHEREAYDLLGIKFNNHPDLRRILLPSDWNEGYPLRKDYEHKPDKYD